jgi:hypothetical protein
VLAGQPGTQRLFFTRRVTRALALLIDEINATPPSLPGDQRPITCQLAKPAQSIWGVVQFLASPDGRVLTGRWLGHSRNGDVINDGVWELVRAAEG